MTEYKNENHMQSENENIKMQQKRVYWLVVK